MKKYILLFLLGLSAMTACRIVKSKADFSSLVEMTAEQQKVLFYLKLNEAVVIDWGDGSIDYIEPQSEPDSRVDCSHTYSNYIPHKIAIRGSSKALLYISCDRNSLTYFRSYNNMNLKDISVSYNRLQNFNVPPSTTITGLGCAYNRISELDMWDFPNVRALSCEQNPISILDVSKNKDLEYLAFCHTEISRINISNNEKLRKIVFHASNISDLDISNNPNLKDIRSYATPLARSYNAIKKVAEKLPSRLGEETGKWYLYNDDVEPKIEQECLSKNWILSRL